MKLSLTNVISLVFALASNGVQANENQVILTGKVVGYTKESVDLYIIYAQPGQSRKQEEIPISEDGSFRYNFESFTFLDAKILDKKTSANIYFTSYPGDSIHLEFSPSQERIDLLKTVVFSGDGLETNNQIIKFQTLREELNLGYGAINPSDSYLKEPSDFINQMGSLKEKQMDLVDQYKLDNDLSKEASEWIEWFALETYYYFLDDYGFEKQNLLDNYYDYNKTLSTISTKDLVCWYILRNRINSYWMNNIKPELISSLSDSEMNLIQDGKMDGDSLAIHYINKNISNDLLSQLLLAHYFNTIFKAKMIDGYEKHKHDLARMITYPFIWQGMNKHYLEAYQFLNKPNKFTAEVLKKIENTPIAETMHKIISDNKGKVVFVDCWATWCGPCIKAMPDSKKLMSKFEGKDIEFVYVCIESNEKLWKRFVSEFELGGGQHYLMDKDQSKLFRNSMDVQGIPEYFLIDKNGNIVDRGIHLQPGDQVTEKRIEELLK